MFFLLRKSALRSQDCGELQEIAFEQEISGFYSRYAHQSWKNVISIGQASMSFADGLNECTAMITARDCTLGELMKVDSS